MASEEALGFVHLFLFWSGYPGVACAGGLVVKHIFKL